MTHTPDEFFKKSVAEAAQDFFDNDPNRKYEVVWRDAGESSIRVEL